MDAQIINHFFRSQGSSVTVQMINRIKKIDEIENKFRGNARDQEFFMIRKNTMNIIEAIAVATKDIRRNGWV